MRHVGTSSYAFIIVFLIFSTVHECTSSSECAGGLLSPANGNTSRTYRWENSLFENKLTLLMIPECVHVGIEDILLGPQVSLNLSYTLLDIPGHGYFIVSGNMTGSGKLEITDGYESTTYMSHSSFVFHLKEGMSTLRIVYTSDDWVEGDGPHVGLFYAPTTSGYCTDMWMKCSVTSDHKYICLPEEWRCNGREECMDGIDEFSCGGCCNPVEFTKTCYNKNYCRCDLDETSILHSINGCTGKSQTVTMRTDLTADCSILPYWPTTIPYNVTYVWGRTSLPSHITITCDHIVVSDGDSVIFRVGDSAYDLSRMSAGMQKRVSLEGLLEDVMLNIVMMSSNSVYNFSYSYVDASSSPTTTTAASFLATGAVPVGAAARDNLYVRSCLYNELWYTMGQACNDHMDCPNGMDEVGCGTYHHACGKDDIMCVGDTKMSGCFRMTQRCDGREDCNNGYDERECDSTLCGTHNGTFLCTDGTCIYETWRCDKTKDCSDGADEQSCDATSLKVVTASVIGSLVCAIMIVMAVGCSCKLHTHRMYERLHQRSRYESPMSRITNELMRRTAPPPYAEAMQRSRPFEEVQSEYLAALELRQREEVTDDAEANLEELSSVASASGTIDALEGSLVEVGEENAVSFRRNPNKPPETNLSEQDQNSRPNVTLEPKSDDETTDNTTSQHTPAANETQTSISPSRRQELRRVSIDSDVSMLSRDSDDVALLS